MHQNKINALNDNNKIIIIIMIIKKLKQKHVSLNMILDGKKYINYACAIKNVKIRGLKCLIMHTGC